MLSQEEIDQINDVLGSVDTSMQRSSQELEEFGASVSQTLAAATQRVSEARGAIAQLTESGDGLRRLVMSAVLTELRPQIRPLTDSLTTIVTEALHSRAADDAAANLLDSAQRLIQARDTVAQSIQGCSESLEALMSGLRDRVVEIGEDVQQRTEQLIGATKDRLEEFSTEVSSEVFDAIETETTEAEEHWHAAMDDVEELIEERSSELADQFAPELVAALGSVADTIRSGLRNLREELESGNREGQSRRAELQTAVDTIKQAIPPLNEAFQAFRSLAGSVGMNI